MKIVSIRVTDTDGVEHEWEGTGHVHVRSHSYKVEDYEMDVTATLFLKSEGKITA